MNYKYKVDDTEVLLSSEEHEIVKRAFEAGKSPVFLRKGTLAINKNFVRYVKESNEPTDLQLEEKRNQLKLAQVQRDNEGKGGKDYLKNTHFAYYEKMGWEHGDKCACKSWVLNS